MASNPSPDVEKVAALLQEKGFRAEIIESGSFVASAAAGLAFVVIPKPTDIQLRCLLERGADSAFGLPEVNKFNADYRFGKLYLDDDGDFVLETDHFGTPGDPSFEQSFDRVIGLWEGLLGLMKEAISRVGRNPPA